MKKGVGETVSALVRKALTQPVVPDSKVAEAEAFHGFRPYRSPNGKPVTNDRVNRLRKDDIY